MPPAPGRNGVHAPAADAEELEEKELEDADVDTDELEDADAEELQEEQLEDADNTSGATAAPAEDEDVPAAAQVPATVRDAPPTAAQWLKAVMKVWYDGKGNRPPATMAPFRERWPVVERLFGFGSYPGGLDTWVKMGGTLQIGSPGTAGEDARLRWIADRLAEYSGAA